MKTTKLALALLALLAPVLARGPIGSPAVAAEGAAPPEPYATVRTLQALQEQVAHGNAAAQTAQAKLMAHIADQFMAADPAVWKQPRNTRAAVAFLLSGGRPSVIRAILDKAEMAPGMEKLLTGALAYGEGSDDVARELLRGIDPKTLPSMLGGHLALVEASLLSENENARAAELLDVARLLVPGTLVEEAALRREMFLLTKPETLDKFVSLSRQYIRRYHASIYAGNFRQRLAAVARTLAATGEVASLSKLESVLGEYPAAEQASFYLAIAKAAIVGGKPVAARYGAEKAAALTGGQGVDGTRSALYAGAALVISEDPSKGLKTLAAVDRSRLSAQDAELEDAALAVAGSVRAESAIAPGASDARDGSGSPVVGHAEAALTRADQLLGEGHP